jgi:hypothetical protein
MGGRRSGTRWNRSSGPDVIVVLMALALLAGCGTSTNRLREAQDSFNQAAAAENALKVSQIDGAGRDARPVVDIATVRSGYASTLMSLNKLEPADIAQLKKDQLWGNVQTLRALSQWRLGNQDAAVRTADETLQAAASGSAGSEVHPRDRAMLQAVRGLVKNDQAYRHIRDNQMDGVDALLVGPNGAMRNLAAARATAEREDPVQIYLLQAELAAYRNFTHFYFAANRQQAVPANHPARAQAQAALQSLSERLKQVRPEDQAAWVKYWATLCGLALPQP